LHSRIFGESGDDVQGTHDISLSRLVTMMGAAMTCRESILFEYLKTAKRRRRRVSYDTLPAPARTRPASPARLWPMAGRLGVAGVLALHTWVMRSLS
jgi:hypothetical protein